MAVIILLFNKKYMNNKNYFIVIKTDEMEDGSQNTKLLLANNNNIEEMLLTAKQFAVDEIKELMKDDYWRDEASYEYTETIYMSIEEVLSDIAHWQEFEGSLFFVNGFEGSYEISITIFSEQWNEPVDIWDVLVNNH